MKSQLEKAIELAKKTGDKIIIIDNDKSFVIIGLEEYEKIAINQGKVRGLTDEELLDRINRDIAIWNQEKNIRENDDFLDFIDDNYNEFDDIDDIDDIDDFEMDNDTGYDVEDEIDDNYYYYNNEYNNNQNTPDISGIERNDNFPNNSNKEYDPRDEESNNYFEYLEKNQDKRSNKNNWKIPSNIKKSAEEIIEKDDF